MSTAFLDDGQGRLRAIQAVRVGPAPGFTVVPGTEFEIPCELALLAMGFTGSEPGGLLEQLGIALDNRGNVPVRGFRTPVDGVFAAGDQARGQSLVVHAINEGRKAAAAVHQYLRV
jgi:glutamate synthase (NADPH) small chain